jgi:hypothetical protein
MRTAGPQEVPKFGSVWSWGRTGLVFMVVGIVARRLQAIWLELRQPEVEDKLIWWVDNEHSAVAGYGMEDDYNGFWCHDE